MQYIFDGQSRKVGYINDTGSTIYAYDKNGRLVGNYQKSSNATYDAKGRRYASGDLTTALIMESAQ